MAKRNSSKIIKMENNISIVISSTTKNLNNIMLENFEHVGICRLEKSLEFYI
jgi:hypothetical protein